MYVNFSELEFRCRRGRSDAPSIDLRAASWASRARCVMAVGRDDSGGGDVVDRVGEDCRREILDESSSPMSVERCGAAVRRRGEDLVHSSEPRRRRPPAVLAVDTYVRRIPSSSSPPAAAAAQPTDVSRHSLLSTFCT